MYTKLVRGYLAYFGLLWLVYSVVVWVRLDWLAYFSGIDFFHSPHGVIEGRAMYGGLEAGLAIFAIVGAARPGEYLMPNCLLWGLVNTGFVVARVIGIIVDGGTFAVPFGVLPDSWNAVGSYAFRMRCAPRVFRHLEHIGKILSNGFDAHVPSSAEGLRPSQVGLFHPEIPLRARASLVYDLGCTLLPFHDPDSIVQPQWATQWFRDHAAGVDMRRYHSTEPAGGAA